MPKLICVLFIQLMLLNFSSQLILKGTLKTDQSWSFIGKFCFITNVGRVQFRVDYPDSYLIQNLLFYYDNQWGNVYPRSSMSCSEKETQLNPSQILNLTEVSFNTYCEDASNVTTCSDTRNFIGARPRYWFVVLSRCYPTNSNLQGLNLNYEFIFTNGNDTFRKHFSADEFGIFETSIAMSIYYFILNILALISAKMLHSKQFFHTTFKLFLSSVFIQFISFVLTLSEYAQFSQTGVSTVGLLTCARVLEAIAQTIFLLMLILLAKGYTVTRARLRKVTKLKIFILFSVYIIAYIIAFAYSEALMDPGIPAYYFNSPAGIAVVCIKIIFGWVWFMYACIFTIKNYPEKRKFYVFLLIFFSLWFWSGPLVIIACNFLVSDHVRNYVAFIVQSGIIAIGHTFFMILTRPTAGNKMFPYHVRTNQIGFIDDENDPKNNFPHHKIDQGGNKEFNDIKDPTEYLTNLFAVKNNGEKYQVNETYMSHFEDSKY